MIHLQIRLPSHHPALPYPINEIYQAAKWVLQGVPGMLSMQAAAVEPAPTVAESGYVKPEQLGSFLMDFVKMIVAAINSSNGRNLSPSNGAMGSGPRTQKCNFDGCDRFIRDCPAVEEYI
jgi:hypothetical protein